MNKNVIIVGALATTFVAGFRIGREDAKKNMKVNPGAHTITAKVSIGKKGEGYGLAVTLSGHLPEIPREQAEALMKAAHQVCPYSNATRGNLDVTLEVA